MTKTRTKTVAGASAAMTVAAFAFTAAPVQAGSNPFLGEIQPSGVASFCPRGTLPAEGQLLPISSNTALFSLLGTRFGGDGRTTFGLPDLRGRFPTHVGTGPGLPPVTMGQKLGREQVTLNTSQMAQHSHTVNATNADGDKPGPGGKILAAAHDTGFGAETIYSDQPPTRTMNASMIGHTGANIPVSVIDASQTIRYCITTIGTYPSRP